MSNENEIEIKCVFGLLDPANTKEIHIQQINNLVNSFDTTTEARRRSKTTAEKPTEEVAAVKAKPKLLPAGGEKRSSGFVISSQKQFGKRNSLKKNTNDSQIALLENPEKLQRGGESKSTLATTENNNEAADGADADYAEVALKSFPNKKKTMNYNEFTDLYENVFHNNSIQDDILLKCFSMFDTEK